MLALFLVLQLRHRIDQHVQEPLKTIALSLGYYPKLRQGFLRQLEAGVSFHRVSS